MHQVFSGDQHEGKYCIHKVVPLDSFLSEANSVHTFIPDCLRNTVEWVPPHPHPNLQV
jgi:hypothetical protein